MAEARGFEHDLDALADPGVIVSPRLGYDIGSLDGYGRPEGSVTDRGEEYSEHDIVVNGRHAPRTVLAPFDCVIRRVGWENPDSQRQGYGYRAYCSRPDGSGVVVAHMEPGSIPGVGTAIRKGASMGRYAVPANGDITGAHLHRGEYDRRGALVRPDLPPPFARPGHMTSGYGMRTLRGKRKMHRGEDWIE